MCDYYEAKQLGKQFDALRARAVAAEAQVARLREAVALLNSMVLSGEDHSEQSQAIVRAALARREETT